jgi:hypothetical protein
MTCHGASVSASSGAESSRAALRGTGRLTGTSLALGLLVHLGLPPQGHVILISTIYHSVSTLAQRDPEVKVYVQTA